jgi:phage terminase small subunit
MSEARKLPLAYMLDVMNDPSADQVRRDRMAIAAAPFVHQRAPEAEKGKKELAQDAAVTAQNGTEWAELLPSSPTQ